MAYVKKSEVKEYIKKHGLRSSEEIFEALDKVIEEHLKKAIERAKANGRKTLKGFDF